ncbi:MAG: NAD/NADP octopine/nopaline dehydrogenase family protein [Pigmentiphaga sp.]
MRVTVLGSGNLGRCLAAYLQHLGHQTTVWGRTVQKGIYAITAHGRISVTADVFFDPALSRAVESADVVISAIPAPALQGVLESLAALLASGQTVLISPAPSASPLIMKRPLCERGVRVPVAGLAATVLTARRLPEGALQVGTLRSSIGLACVDPADTPQVLTLCEELFGTNFYALDSILALTLAYVTPVVHGPLMLGNLSRIENAESWREFECTTPAISSLVEALDAERLALAKACNIPLPSFIEHCNTSFGTRLGHYQAIAESVARARHGGPFGPINLHTRQITEDLPYGLMVYSRLGNLANVSTPLTDAVCVALSVACRPLLALENPLFDFVDEAFRARRDTPPWPSASAVRV